MSEAELQRNPVLTDYTVRDLNADPTLPYEDNSFDVITNVVSVDYLNKPLVRLQPASAHCRLQTTCVHCTENADVLPVHSTCVSYSSM